MEAPLLSVASLHALAYCERLFYLEEVERIRVADAAVYAGRRLHTEIMTQEEDEGSWSRLTFESSEIGICGTVDVLRRRDGKLIPYEHKRGRSAGKKGAREAWQTDRLQIGAYALLVEEAHGQSLSEGRVRYHADGVTVVVPIDEPLREEVRKAVVRAREIRRSVERPPVVSNERLCARCSLAIVCLPEEARLGSNAEFKPIRLLPEHPVGQTLHVAEQGAQVGRSGNELAIRTKDGEQAKFPIVEIGQVVLHGYAQISTQALRLCADRDIGVHWMTLGGGLVGSLAPTAGSAQRHIRQFTALSKPDFALELARKLVTSKLDNQLRYVLRATRGDSREATLESSLRALREMRRMIGSADNPETLLGLEGNGAAAYFRCLPYLLEGVNLAFQFDGRSRQPPKDRFNSLLGYGYGMLYREVLQAIVSVGLHPGFGFYHRPRSSAHPLALDVMELFRVPLVDMAIIAAVKRQTFDPKSDFDEVPGRVLLNENGRRKVIEVVERRKADVWKHNVVGYSLSYARMIELEVRLLEKEWMGEGGLFARFRTR